MKAQGKVIVVTGAGSGIGEALVGVLLEKGAMVAAVDLRQESLKALQKKFSSQGDNLSVHTCDIADQKSVHKLPDAVVAAHGTVDAIINNAGIIQPFVKIDQLEEAMIEKVMQVNWRGPLAMVRAFLPMLKQRAEAHIVNISSMGGFLPVPGQTIYGASKAAVKLFTEGLYAELTETAVGVTVVFPGAIATNITKNSNVKLPDSEAIRAQQEKFKPLPAQEAARCIVAGMERNKFQVYVGKDAKMMNLLYRLHPRFATQMIAKQMKALLPD